MFQYKKYLIGRSDSFDPFQFPNVVNELKMVKKNLTYSGIAYKEDMLISYLKKSSLDADRIPANSDLSSLISNSVFTTDHLKALFECSEGNIEFQKQYEKYLRKTLAHSEL